MTRTLLISGLPKSLAQDGWWLDDPSDAPPTPPRDRRTAQDDLPLWAGLAVLILLADFLFWHQRLGLSLALFALAILIVAVIGSQARHNQWRPMMLLAVAAAPVVDHLQALSVGFLVLGLVMALIWVRRPEASSAEIIALVPAFLRRLPGQWVTMLTPQRRPVGKLVRVASDSGSVRRLLRDWAFPLAGGVVLVALLMQANPLLARFLEVDLDLWTTLSRGLFWGGTALFLVPLLRPDLPEPMGLPCVTVVSGGRIGLNAGSVLRALVLFNFLIAVQTATDLSILALGAALPQGMSLAEYAHRGAYPLLVTALLAGAFALAARPFFGEHRAIPPLLFIWLAQNMVLCGAAMLRLEHYIDAFGLTYLRLYALIWMGLVAIGLGLVLVQLMRKRSNRWLLARCTFLGLGTLYICAFVNFAHIIAAQNLGRTNSDTDYICALGPMAHAALGAASVPDAASGITISHPCAILYPPTTEGWRDWGFRSWRVVHYNEGVAALGQEP